MANYYITYNDYFGWCVVEEINGNGRIVFTGTIEEVNAKCIELNSSRQARKKGFSGGSVPPLLPYMEVN